MFYYSQQITNHLEHKSDLSQKRSSPPKEFNVIAKENIHNYPYSDGNYIVNLLTQNNIKVQ